MRAARAKPASVTMRGMWKRPLPSLHLLAPAGAARDAAVLAVREQDMAAVDSVVDRLHRHAAERPAA